MIRQKSTMILILLLAVAGFFYFSENCWATNHIVISNFATHGPAGARDEFVELYNPTGEVIDLEGWKLQTKSTTGDSWTNRTGNSGLPAGIISSYSYYLLAAKDYSLSRLPDFRHSANWSLSDSGGYIRIIDNLNQEIDKIGYGDADVSQLYCGNGILEEIEKCDDGNNINGDSCSADCKNETSYPSSSLQDEDKEEQEEIAEPQNKNVVVMNKLGDAVINEFVSDPADEDVEWIELYNTTGADIDLAGWTIEEGSGAKTNLTGVIAASGDGKFMVIEKPKGNLNNGGDIIILRGASGQLIDKAAYGDWDNGDAGNNAPAANDPNSIARKFDGLNSFNNAEDFAITAAATKGTSNIIAAEDGDANEINQEGEVIYNYSNDIIISEIFPNPAGSDNENEFIELYNKGDRDIDLTGWELGDDSKKKYEIANSAKSQISTIIKTKGYLTIYRSESKIALNNSGDSVKLYQPLKDEPSQTVKYEKAIEGWSYNLNYESLQFGGQAGIVPAPLSRARPGNYKYVWGEIITPGKENIIKTINHPPIADFDCPREITAGTAVLFDGSDAVDEDGDELKYFWDFGDGMTNELASPEHTFLKQGAYAVKLTVSDGENETVKEKIIKAAENLKIAVAGQSQSQAAAEIIINEFLPNTEGTDTEEEWIELKNAGSAKINLLNWKLDDSEDGSKPHIFKNDLWLDANKFFAIERVESGLALNNNADAIRLFNDLDEMTDEVEYEATVKGASYARGQNGKWFWTDILTPGEENIISVGGPETADYETADGKIGAQIKKTGQIIETTLEKIKEFEAGDLIKVKGTVAVEPGILGSQYFYIVGSPGIQIYNYKKEFPGLRVGDYVEVSGELSAGAGEPRLKTKQADDIAVISHGEPPAANEAACEKISDDYVGQLVRIAGEVVEKKSSLVYLDDGTDEVVVYIKKATGINSASIKEGEKIAVTGLVGRTQSGVRIMPRSADDIVKKDGESAEGAGDVLGEIMANDEWEIAKRDKKLELFKYLLLLAGGAIAALAGLLVKTRR